MTRHGNGFLMVTATGVDPQSTNTTQLLLFAEEPAPRTADLAVVIYPLRPRPGAAGDLISIGRDGRQDVTITDISISRLHALAKLAPDGSFLLQDMGSSNGTSVNGVSVPPRGAGLPVQLKPGDLIKFGQLDFTFSDAAALRDFALKLRG